MSVNNGILIAILCVVCVLLAVGILLAALMLLLLPTLRIMPKSIKSESKSAAQASNASGGTKTTETVVSAYRENLNWLRDLPRAFSSKNHRLTVYSKHPDTAVFHVDNVESRGGESATTTIERQSIQLPNVGRCDHTYLYHIVHNYDRLADVTVFVTGSADEIRLKRFTLRQLISPRLGAQFRVLGHVVPLIMPSFQLDTYKATGRANSKCAGSSNNNNNGREDGDVDETESIACVRSRRTIPARVRPFSAWWYERFPERQLPRFFCMGGVFAASRDAIRAVPIDVWQMLLEEHEEGDNLEVGHFMERSWYALLNGA